MNAERQIHIRGIGAVCPAGWGMDALRQALTRGEPIPARDLPRPGWTRPLRVRQTPAASPRPAFATHTRLRRTSPIAHYTVSAALEALGDEVTKCASGFQLGIVYCAMCGCVNYSRRFYDETLHDPATASPLVFPETVYNSPASHLAALIGTRAINYTLVGDPGTYLQGLALAADWLSAGRVDGCLVIGAEEMDWLTADAARLFGHSTVIGDGAGAVYLGREPHPAGDVRLDAITSPHLFHGTRTRAEAARRARAELRPTHVPSEVVCDSLRGIPEADRDEWSAWGDWPDARLSVKTVLGEAFMAAAAWQCVAAVDALRQKRYAAATVSVVGCNQQAIAARFVR